MHAWSGLRLGCAWGFGSALFGCKGCVEVGAILELFTGDRSRRCKSKRATLHDSLLLPGSTCNL